MSHLSRIPVEQRVGKLRIALQQLQCDGCLVCSEDIHFLEFPCEHDRRRAFISGFSGSAGVALIGPHACWLWTDGRYFEQAQKELTPDWTLMKSGVPGVPTVTEFLAQSSHSITALAVHVQCIRHEFFARLKELGNLRIVCLNESPVDTIWTDQPALPCANVVVYPLEYAGQAWDQKLEIVAKKLRSDHVDALIITDVDDIAWLYNLRGSDVPFTPFFFAFSTIEITCDLVIPKLFLRRSQLDPAVVQHLAGVQIHGYDESFGYFKTIAQKYRSVQISDNVAQAVYSQLAEAGGTPLLKRSPITAIKVMRLPDTTFRVGRKKRL